MRRPDAKKKTAPKTQPAPQGGFSISEKSKAEVAAGKGTKSDFEKIRFDLFPSPEFMLAALDIDGAVGDMLRSAYQFWNCGDPQHLLDAVVNCADAMGCNLGFGSYPSPEFMDVVGRIATKGAQKYSDRNWENGMRWGRMFAAFVRHTLAHERGDVNDPETGESHLGHAGWNLIALYTHAVRGLGEDNRGLKKAA